MIVNSHNTHNLKPNIIEIIGVIRGDAAIKLQRCSFDYLDKGDCYQLINLAYAKSIDGMGINVLENLINRGVCIRLFNVQAEIRKVIRMSGKEDIFKVYNEQNSHKAVSMFEKEILEQSTAKDDIRKREYPRADAFFKADFKYHPGHNGVISGRATILNLSEGGMFAEQVLAKDAKTKDVFIPEKIAGQELYDMKFRLNKDSSLIEAGGVCVREFRDDGKLSAGIRFKDMRQEYKEMIRDYVRITDVYETLQNNH